MRAKAAAGRPSRSRSSRAIRQALRADRQQERRPRGGGGPLEAYSLGLGDPVPVSAEHDEGMSDLDDASSRLCPGRKTAR